jgi:hypothetical protein
MNTEKLEATATATIAELWDEFDGLVRLSIPHLAKLVSPAYNVDAARRPEYEQQLKQCNERLAEIRDQLIERCAVVPDQDGDPTTFLFACGGDRLATEPCGILDRIDNIETAREISAAYAFWAWELEQRQKGQATT